MRAQRTALIHGVLLAAVALPYWLALGTSSIWDANEAFYAETPREMIERNDYLAPQFNYRTRAQKPPLTYWAVALSYRIFGVGEFAVRVPGALAATGALLFTYALGGLLFNRRAGLIAAAILGTTVRFFVITRKLPIDALMIFFLVATAYFLVRGLQRGSRGSWAAAYVFAGLGCLTKGPIALVIPAGALLLWIAAVRPARLPRVYPLLGAAILVAVVTPWYALTFVFHGWTYIADFFLKDNLGRYATETFGPSRGPLYYVAAYASDFFPWSVLSVPAGAWIWRNRRALRHGEALTFTFPLVWAAFVLLFYTASKNKQEYYILPVYPMAALLIAGAVERWSETSADRLKRVWKGAYLSVAFVFAALSAVSVFVLRTALPDLPAVLDYVPSMLLGSSMAALVWSSVRCGGSKQFLSLVIPLWLLLLATPVFYLPAIEQFRPVKDMCAQIRLHAGPEDEIGYYRATAPSMVFYLRRPIFEEFLPDFMIERFASDKRIFCLMSEQDYGYFVGRRDLILYVLDRRPRLVTQLRGLLSDEAWAEQELLLVSNRPGDETGAAGRERP